MFAFFERLIRATDPPPSGAPPAGLLAFYWHFVRQTKGLYAVLFVTGAMSAGIDTLIPVFMSRVVRLAGEADARAALQTALPGLLVIGALVVIGAPLVFLADSLVRHVALTPGTNILVRWQSHWHVVRQSWPFFQNDFAGRIANRVMGVGGALRETLLASIRAVWFLMIYATTAVGLLTALDWRLALPVLGWFGAYALMLRYFVPRMRDRSKAASLARSLTSGRVVDSFTNILTVKLFARASDEDAYIREAMEINLKATQAEMRLDTMFVVTLSVINTTLLAATSVTAIWLWQSGRLAGAAIALALPLVWRITTVAGWVAWEIASVFENIGTVQEAMLTISAPHTLVDAPDAPALKPGAGEIRFDHVSFGYSTHAPVLRDLNLVIKPGEKIGLIGKSGAGKSTLVNLLLRFYDIDSGTISIDGQDIAKVTQESLRGAIGMVTQDTSLLHRSVGDNIRYGRFDAGDAEVADAARRAHADEFIDGLQDFEGRTGYHAKVGERGVKLSGGQRQRVAIARVILKNAPVLVLDEATSALDSEVEAAIQEQLDGLMQGKTVIAIAHRLSTIARLDRLVVLDGGRIAEEGSHAGLLAQGGIYADLWRRQSGGFLGAVKVEPPALAGNPELIEAR